MKELLKPAYFTVNQDAEDADEVLHTFDVENLQVNFTAAYFIKGDTHLQEIVKLLGANHPLVKELKETVKISVDVTNLPAADASKLAKDITALAIEHDIRPVVDRKPFVTETFHSMRHVYLSPSDNTLLDETLPLVIQVAPIA